jgi:DNA (cytosine-5)-methyltransferase 1
MALEKLIEAPDWFGPIVGVHASPPCQGRTRGQRIRGNDHPELVGATRALLERTGLPYVIENVPGKVANPDDELRDPIMLCGTMFGLRLYRHRLFECSFEITEPLHGQHYLRQVKMGRKPGPDDILQPVGNFTGVDEAREAMGMPWASRDGLREAIPPAYTEFIGQHLMDAIDHELAA